MRYNLTVLQKLLLPIVWIMWVTTDSHKRKTWHLVKKGMEPHVHRFTIPIPKTSLMQCEHEGCNLCDDPTI